ncbi:MAG TPA: hypothetical protein PKD72_04460, partial [Gemmatales bacterium]|nr:hypothetical protein [Gemmatales bacterium]
MSSSPVHQASVTSPVVTLSELDHRAMTVRDWLTLLPAVLLSIVLNGIFLATLIVTSPATVRADSKLRNSANDDITQMEENNSAADEDSPIDIFTPELDAPKDLERAEKLAMPSLEIPDDVTRPSLSTPPPEKDPIGGSGLGDDGKIKGNDL